MDSATSIEKAIERFYLSGDTEAHTWLLQIQASKEAWNFIWDLLDSTKSSEVQFFAATTLHEKILNQWEDIPKTEYLSLRDRIIFILKCPSTSKLVLSRVCQALAAFTTKYSMSQEEKAKCMVEELMEVLPFNSQDTVGFLVKVLEAIPREFDRKVGAKQIKMHENLIINWHKTSWLLHQIFSSCEQPVDPSTSTLYFAALECTVSWLRIGHLPLDTIVPIYHHLLVAASIYLPNRDDMGGDCTRAWEIAQDGLTMALTHNELFKRPQLLWEWSKDLICMIRQNGGKYFYEILAAFGETHSRSLLIALASQSCVEEKWVSQNLIEILLECSEQEGRYPTDERRSIIPFGFWYALQDDIGTLDGPIDDQASQVLKPIYARLAQALLVKSMLPTSSAEAGSPDERELFRCYRQDIADTLTYCHNVLFDDLLVLLGQKLSTCYNDSSRWTEVESYIHGFRALCDNVNQDCKYIPAILDLILTHIPYNQHPKEVLSSTCLTIGDFAEWIGVNHDPWLEKSLQLVVLGLTQGPATAPAASIALKDISRECKGQIAPLAPSILHTISQTLPTMISGGGEALRLMFAAGKLLNSLSTVEEQIAHLETTLGLCILKVRELLQQPVNQSQLGVVNQLKMISMFLTTLEGPIGKSVLEVLLPIFQAIVAHPEWSQHDQTLEGMHTCANKSLSSLEAPQLAKPLLPILSTSYKTRPHPAALQFLKQLVLLFGRDPENNIGPVFREISELTLAGVITCRQMKGNLSELSDLLQSYLELLAQICKKNARLILQVPDQVPEMFNCGIACLLLPETGTVRSAGSFLTHAITQSPHLQTFIQPIGQELVGVIMRCIAGCVPSNSLEPHAEILVALNKTCLEWNAQWLKYALRDNFFPNIPQNAKEIFIQDVLRERTNKRRMFDKLKDFNLQIITNYYRV